MQDSHRRASELHDLAAHAHRAAAERPGKQDHLTGHELSRQALEHSQQAHQMSLQAHAKTAPKPTANASADDAPKWGMAHHRDFPSSLC